MLLARYSFLLISLVAGSLRRLGIFTILLAIAIWLVFCRASPKGRRNWIGLSIVIFQYILSTAHFFMAFYQDIKLLGGGDPGPFADIQYHGKMAFTQVATEFFSVSA